MGWINFFDYPFTRKLLSRNALGIKQDMYDSSPFAKRGRYRDMKPLRLELLLLDLIIRLKHVIYMSPHCAVYRRIQSMPRCIVEHETTIISINQPPTAENGKHEGGGDALRRNNNSVVPRV